MQIKLLVLLLLLGTTTSDMAHKKTIETEIIINAKPSAVWQVLTDFSKFPEWNPFITSITGEAVVGAKLKADIAGMTFKPKVLIVQTNKEFRWLGSLLFKGLFDGEHIFQLIDNGDGTTTFKQSENFNGILVGMFSKKLDNETKSGFDSMNLALKKRVESSAQ